MKLDPRQSHYVLQALLAQRKVGARHIKQILRGRQKEIAALRERLATLEGLGGRSVAGTGRRTARAARGAAAKAPVKHRLSPRVRSLRRQQGRYMGLVRRLTEAQRASVRTVLEKKGLPAAIRVALSLGRS
jgi:hypothetical protein